MTTIQTIFLGMMLSWTPTLTLLAYFLWREETRRSADREAHLRSLFLEYEEANLADPKTYLRLLDADAEGADWREVARLVLHRDPESDGTRRAFESHLARARWMTDHGYRQLLRRR
jgi:Uncharacterized conserved protein (DUF2285)